MQDLQIGHVQTLAAFEDMFLRFKAKDLDQATQTENQVAC